MFLNPRWQYPRSNVVAKNLKTGILNKCSENFWQLLVFLVNEKHPKESKNYKKNKVIKTHMSAQNQCTYSRTHRLRL